MGPRLSGSNLHIDPLCTAAWNTVLQGHKFWLLFPPDTPEALLRPSTTGEEEEARCDEGAALINGAAAWYAHIHPKTREADWPKQYKPIEILQVAGETMFVPQGWWHAVLNLDLTVSVTQNFAGEWDFEDVWEITRNKRRWMIDSWLQGLHHHYPDLVSRVQRPAAGGDAMDISVLRRIFEEVDVKGKGALGTEAVVKAVVRVHTAMQSGKSTEELRAEVYFNIDELDADDDELTFAQFHTLVKSISSAARWRVRRDVFCQLSGLLAQSS